VIDEYEVLKASAARLRALVEPLDAAQRRSRAYPEEWTVADVLGHLGSGAAISTLWIDQALGGPQVVPQPIWDEWNAKDPDAKAADALTAVGALLERIDAVTERERGRFTLVLGPMNLGFGGFLRTRINEQTLHIWDIEVPFDPSAALAPDAVPTVLDAMPMIAGFAAKPTGTTMRARIRTTAPEQHFVVDLHADRVSFSPRNGEETDRDADDASNDLELPAEALIRLVYGRLDRDHTPPFTGDERVVEELRRVFPGV
jgi:uncharacterized protein (TIGR03083 family)